jgi:hypothetical protein
MRDETAINAGCTQRAYLYLERDHDPAGAPYSSRDLDQMMFDPNEVTTLVELTPTRVLRPGHTLTSSPAACASA